MIENTKILIRKVISRNNKQIDSVHGYKEIEDSYKIVRNELKNLKYFIESLQCNESDSIFKTRIISLLKKYFDIVLKNHDFRRITLYRKLSFLFKKISSCSYTKNEENRCLGEIISISYSKISIERKKLDENLNKTLYKLKSMLKEFKKIDKERKHNFHSFLQMLELKGKAEYNSVIYKTKEETFKQDCERTILEMNKIMNDVQIVEIFSEVANIHKDYLNDCKNHLQNIF